MVWGMFDSLLGRGPKAHLPRGAERYHVVGLTCPLGDVMDLSASGLRVRFHDSAPVKKGDIFSVNVSNESQSVKVTARVVWIRRRPLQRGGQIGLQFVNIRPGVAAALVQLARFGHISTAQAMGASDPEPAAKPAPEADPAVTASIDVEDLYAVIGVPFNATDEDIRRAYHVLAKELHPDHNSSGDAALRFADVSKAYKVLRDPQMRRRYDELLTRCKRRPAA
jgi:hypothetical protein